MQNVAWKNNRLFFFNDEWGADSSAVWANRERKQIKRLPWELNELDCIWSKPLRQKNPLRELDRPVDGVCLCVNTCTTILLFLSGWNLIAFPQTDLWWRWGRGYSRPLMCKRWRPRRRASWLKTPHRMVRGQRCGCCSYCCVSSWLASDRSGWGRAHSVQDGHWRALHFGYRIGTSVPIPCPLYFWHNPLSSLQEGYSKLISYTCHKLCVYYYSSKTRSQKGLK